MNVYDFDGTIYKRDSSADFLFFALRRRPALLRYCVRQAFGALRYATKRITLTRFKSELFCFMNGVSDAEALVAAFWDAKQGGVHAWYLAQKDPEDVVITASPDFLVRPMCRRLGLTHIICSEVDPHTGRWLTENNKGTVKTSRFFAAFPDGTIDKFYSDSLSDAPLAALANEAYFVRGETLAPWTEAR